MQKNWRTDWFLVGCLSGSIASIFKTLVNLTFYKTKIANIHYVDIAGGMILGKRNGEKPRKPLEHGLGVIADTILGSMFGACLAWLIGKTPKGYDEIKGGLFGTTLWSTTLALGTLLHIDGLTKPKARTIATMLSSSVAFGTSTGWLIKRLSQFDQAKVQQPTSVKIQETDTVGITQLQEAAK